MSVTVGLLAKGSSFYSPFAWNPKPPPSHLPCFVGDLLTFTAGASPKST